MSKPSKKELTVKSLVYRLFVIVYELTLAFIFGMLGFTLASFVVANNIIKFVGYLFFELLWFEHFRTRLNLLGKFLKKISLTSSR